MQDIIPRHTTNETATASSLFSDLPEALMVEIYEFLFELPIVPYHIWDVSSDEAITTLSNQNSNEKSKDYFWKHHSQCTLAFPHTCRKIMMALEKNPKFQLTKFIQFYCLGIKNQRYDNIEKLYSNIHESSDVWKQMIPIVIFLNFPSLAYVESLEFNKDMVPLERRFRKAYHLHTHLDYVDFLFKIDRIVEMLTTFVNCVKKDIRNTYGSLHDISSIPLNFPISNENYTITVTYSQLTQILNEADKVVSACMKLFHWKAYKEYYFEEMYLEIPEELPRIRENYQICAKLCNALQNSSMNDEDLNHLFSKLNCYYCDKLSAACYYSRRFSNKNVLLHSVHNNTGVIDSKNENDKCDKYDQQVIERALFAYGELFNRLPAYLQQDEKLLMIALQKGLPLNKLVRNYAFESPNSAVQNKLFLKAVDIMLEDYDFAFGIISTLAYRRSRLSCIAYYVKRRLTSTKLLDEDPSKYTKYNCLFVDWEMMYLIFRADCYSARSSATTACATHFVNVLMKLENGEVDGVNICIPSLSPEAKNYIIRHNKKFFYSLYSVNIIEHSDYTSVYGFEE